MSRHIVMPGGSGFLGRHLLDRLITGGDRVTILTRGRPRSGEGWQALHWDGRTVGPWSAALEEADAVVHLSGKRVDSRPTKANVDELISSRVEPVRAVGAAVARLDSPPPTWVQLSSLAIYGEGGDTIIDESTPLPTEGPRPMVEVCRRWEAAFDDAAGNVSRTVLLRPGIAIGGAGDPATERLVWLTRWGLGGTVLPGSQWVSWIGLDDFMEILLRAIGDEAMTGTYHVTAPNPVRNREMMAAYRRAVGRRFGVPAPRLVTTLGAWILGSDPALALTGRRGVPTRLLDEGYRFLQPDFAQAVERAVADVSG